LAVAAAIGSPKLAWGRSLPQRLTGLNRRAGWLHLSVGIQDLFFPWHRDRLESGFSARVLIRASMVRDGSSHALASAFQQSDLVYDIWDEQYRIERETGYRLPNGSVQSAGDHIFAVRNQKEALRATSALVQFPLVRTAELTPGEPYRVAIRADLNPVSQELVANVRSSLTRPRKSRRATDKIFGSFVRVFVDPRIEESERQVRFVSQIFRESAP